MNDWQDLNLFSDSRTQGGARAGRRSFDPRRMVLIFTVNDAAGDEQELALPASFVVCPTCEGHGRHVNPSIDAGGITGSEWAEWDAEEQESYLSGGYDVTCYECQGARVVPEIDEARADPAELARVREYEREVERCDRENAYERAAGA